MCVPVDESLLYGSYHISARTDSRVIGKRLNRASGLNLRTRHAVGEFNGDGWGAVSNLKQDPFCHPSCGRKTRHTRKPVPTSPTSLEWGKPSSTTGPGWDESSRNGGFSRPNPSLASVVCPAQARIKNFARRRTALGFLSELRRWPGTLPTTMTCSSESTFEVAAAAAR